MRIVPTRTAKPGMRLGRPIIATDGRLILAAGVSLCQNYIDQLLEQGYSAVYIADHLGDVELPEEISGATRREVTHCISEFVRSRLNIGGLESSPVLSRSEAKKRSDVERKVVDAAKMLVGEILAQKEVVVGLVDVKSLHDYTFAHSVQVALLSVIVGKVMKWTEPELFRLGMGALLHDVGKTSVPESIWRKQEQLTKQEFEAIKTHAGAGFAIIRQTDVGLIPAHVAFQHHERMDGSGYPRKLKGDGMLKHARVCAVCDVYDAMTSDRPYKAAHHPCEALEFIAAHSGRLFDPNAVQALLKVVAPYPIATSVILSTNEVAVVKKLNYDDLSRPTVVVTKDPQRNWYRDFREIDLSSQSEISIVNYHEWYLGENEEPKAIADATATGI